MLDARKYIPPESLEEYTEHGYWEESRTLFDYFLETASNDPEREMVVDGPRRFTYQRMKEYIERICSGLRRVGVTKGDVVSFQLPNCAETLAIYLACKALGAVCNPIIPIYRGEELRFILNQARSKVLFIPGALKNMDFPAMIDSIRPGTPDLEQVIVLAESGAEGMIPLPEFMAMGEKSQGVFEKPEIDPNDVSLLMYTSGTTSEPKGVMHTHNTILWEAKSVRELMGLREDYTVLAASPVTHIGGLWANLEYTALVGGKVVFMAQWNPQSALELLQNEKCSFMTGPTPFLSGICSHPNVKDYDLGALKSFGCGGAPVPPKLIHYAINELGIHCGRGYGLTEFSTITLYSMEDPIDKLATTDGRAAPGVEIRIVDLDTGRDLGPGEEGEILARGPECFVGYTNPELNEEAFQGRWFRTGDLGMLDEQGYLSITGRKKDIIIRSGENLSAKEIEDALHSHPKLAEVSVVGIPDPKTGERAIAVVTPAKDANEITLDEIRDFLIQKEMAKQKIPEGLVIVADLPKTPTGKVRKNILREQTAKKLGIGRYC